MTAKEFLLQYGSVLEKIERNKEKILLAEKMASQQCRNNYYIYTSEYQDRLYSENEDLMKIVIAIELAVEGAPCSDSERKVLYRRYILGEIWEEISSEMNYSVTHLHRLEKSALAHVRIPNEYKYMPFLISDK